MDPETNKPSLNRTPSQSSYSSTIDKSKPKTKDTQPGQSPPSQSQSQSQSQQSTSPPQDTPSRPQYVYAEPKKGGPNPDYQPKPKSRFSMFLSKFQSPAVKASTAIRERELAEDERLGVTRTQVSDVGRSSNAWALS